MELRLSLYSSKSPSWYSDYPFTHHSLPSGSDNPYTHHSLPGGTQTIPILITVSLVVLRLSLHSSQSPWWYSHYRFTHYCLPVGTQTIPLLITVCLMVLRLSILTTVSVVVLRLFLYSSKSTWWLRQSLYSSQSHWWYSENLCTLHSLPGGTQTIPILITVSLVVLNLSLHSSQSP